ncbi:hypothetical protein X943_000201 [Babesia divergens]|uniref:Uncharacterized protein n=1 Tax=Babesia divergens TaxID=32595 RepID=A0AAD9LHI7_BABDI|nr:hypothetical protein X943_000201 [Babesia divergens]
MLPQLDDEDGIRRELEASLGLDAVDSGDEVQEELEALGEESEETHRKRGGVGYREAKKARVFCAEETKLKEALKPKKKPNLSRPKASANPYTDSTDEEEISRVDMILRAARSKREEREKRRMRRFGKT